MKVSTCLAGLVFAHNAVAMGNRFLRLQYRQASASFPPVPNVPTYNFTMPVDHFDKSNTQTYNNRYMVNDTYYEAGGPVIVCDMGESGIDPTTAAQFFAEYNGTTSAALRLAQRLNGLVIGWEHRYYGFSHPVPMDYTSGVPVEGASGYKFLTVEQALEDLAYFANGFNKTQLSLNRVVSNTAGLDPYNTPWLIVGGSYPGMRAAWSRLKHPEVFYASWASSAPVQARYDGSIYFNPIYQALPTNCTNDIIAVSNFVDNAIKTGDTKTIENIQAGIYISTVRGAGYGDLGNASSYGPFDIASALVTPFETLDYQGLGAHHTTQVFCDLMESFDAQAFLNNQTSTLTLAQEAQIALENPGNVRPTDRGIAAANGKQGGALAFAAWVYATYFALADYYTFVGQVLGPYEQFSQTVDSQSWSWQTLNQLGFYQGSNASNPYNMLSQFYNVTSYRQLAVESQFTTFVTSDFPSKIDATGPLSFGGWNMKASNVMFTNGEFDPWRAFGLMSQETAAGAPQRTVTQNVPACNKPPAGSDVFGLLYDGGVHVEDIAFYSAYLKGDTDTTNRPLFQGLDLFVNAYHSWLPCFNQSRDDIRNGKGVDGQGDGANGAKMPKSGSTRSFVSSLWLLLGATACIVVLM